MIARARWTASLLLALFGAACRSEAPAAPPPAPPGEAPAAAATSAAPTAASAVSSPRPGPEGQVAELGQSPAIASAGSKGEKASQQLIAIGPAKEGRLEVWLGDGPRTVVPRSPSANDFAEIAEVARARAKDSPPAILVAEDKSVPHGHVIALLDALKAAGFNQVALAVEPAAK